jgi:ribosomal-protein-alanine N-acetyltransferase
MPELTPLRAGHAAAVLTFELANRVYFATMISDRGDAFFTEFAQRHQDLLTDQQAGTRACYLLLDDDGAVLGRFNLVNIHGHTAELGYRVAQHAAGRGVATATVRELCQVAAHTHGLRTLRAAVSERNAASRKVLENNGFVPVGPAGPSDLGGKHGTWFQRDLAELPGAAQVQSQRRP